MHQDRSVVCRLKEKLPPKRLRDKGRGEKWTWGKPEGGPPKGASRDCSCPCPLHHYFYRVSRRPAFIVKRESQHLLLIKKVVKKEHQVRHRP